MIHQCSIHLTQGGCASIALSSARKKAGPVSMMPRISRSTSSKRSYDRSRSPRALTSSKKRRMHDATLCATRILLTHVASSCGRSTAVPDDRSSSWQLSGGGVVKCEGEIEYERRKGTLSQSCARARVGQSSSSSNVQEEEESEDGLRGGKGGEREKGSEERERTSVARAYHNRFLTSRCTSPLTPSSL